MLRPVALSVALFVLAACALVEPPPPPGTRPFQAEVRNMRSGPVELTVSTPAGVLGGAVQPATVPAGSTTNVTFHVPVAGQWSIVLDGKVRFGTNALNSNIGICTMVMELPAGGGGSMGCPDVP